MYSNAECARRWREKHSKICPSCGNKMSYESKHCIRCSGLESKATIRKEMTIGEYREKMLERGYHRSWLHSEVRNFARSWNEKLRKSPCQNCGYSKHVELCHKIPLVAFPDDTKLGVVNSPENLYVLCPNCHWELDNGILKLDIIL